MSAQWLLGNHADYAFGICEGLVLSATIGLCWDRVGASPVDAHYGARLQHNNKTVTVGG